MKAPAPGNADAAAAELRRRAEARLRSRPPEHAGANATADVQRLLHSLQVHQIELELQNEELNRAQAETRAALERYADFYDFSPVGFFSLKDDGSIARVNLTGARLLGLERSRLIDRRLGAFVIGSQRPAFNALLRSMFAGEARQSCELELMADGQPPRTVRLDAMISPDRQECRAVMMDVTGHKQMECTLRESERRFHDIAEISADWIWEVDITGCYTYASESVQMLLGYKPEQLIGKTAFDLMPADEAVRVRAAFAAIALRRESFRDLENIVLDSRDGRHDTLTSGMPVCDAAGRLIGYRGVDRDITERRQAEKKLLDLAKNLETNVNERTAQLRKLSAQLTMTEERERRVLAQDLHDNLGQLLAVIKIKLTSLPGGSLPPSIREVVDRVEQAERAARSISQQLSPPILQRLGLGPALEWLGEEMMRTYGLAVDIDFDACGGRLVDEVQAVLYRSTRELLINVAKHAGVGHASLTCLCDGNRLLIVVSDAGCGFDPGEHLGKWTGHSGFGLRSVRERMANLGGEMDIDSSPGNGATVTLGVPCLMEGKEIHGDPDNSGR